ncbi:MAG: class I SAM-dependent methyltransferase [Ignavibacteriaceae bacterium]
MNTLAQNLENVKEAFSRQSINYDLYEEENIILAEMRKRVRDHLLRYLNKDDRILELNAGTGLDATFFAGKGFQVHATDFSPGMILQIKNKIKKNNLFEKISVQQCSFTNLDEIKTGPFDYIFSNFGGLNCIPNLREVTKIFPKLLKPGGKITLVLMPKISPWELALMFKGNFKTAFRRFSSKQPNAKIEGIKFISYYHSPHKVIKSLDKRFKILKIVGLSSLAPPPFVKNLPFQHPDFYRFLQKLDYQFSHLPLLNRWADHYIITLQYL